MVLDSLSSRFISDFCAVLPEYAPKLRADGANGGVWSGVRHAGGHCIGALRSRAVGIPHQECPLKDHWTGVRGDRSIDDARDQWVGL